MTREGAQRAAVMAAAAAGHVTGAYCKRLRSIRGGTLAGKLLRAPRLFVPLLADTQRTVVPAADSHGGVGVCHVTSVGGCVRIPGALRHSSPRPQQQEEERRCVGGHR